MAWTGTVAWTGTNTYDETSDTSAPPPPPVRGPNTGPGGVVTRSATWLLNEDAALKAKLQGLTVTDENAPSGGREVAVRFTLPEVELADATFPRILISPPHVSRAPEREYRGAIRLPYIPQGVQGPVLVVDPDNADALAYGGGGYGVAGYGGFVVWDGDSDVGLSPFSVPDVPIPYNLDYDVSVFARKQSHIQQLVNALSAIDRIPNRFGYLEIPEDGTVRTLEVLNTVAIDAFKDSDGKRTFRADYSVRVFTELSLYDVTRLNQYVTSVDISVADDPSLG